MEQILTLLFLLSKHFVVDFPLQTEYQWKNKGKYMHMGGILHSFLHSVGTYLCFFVYFPRVALLFSIFDFILHYHIDYFKVNINEYYKLGANTHKEFWWLLGLDQYLHQLTYIVLVAYAVK